MLTLPLPTVIRFANRALSLAVLASDVVVSTLGEVVDGLATTSPETAAVARYLLKLVLCESQKAARVLPLASRTVRELHWGRWDDPTLVTLRQAVADGWPKGSVVVRTSPVLMIRLFESA